MASASMLGVVSSEPARVSTAMLTSSSSVSSPVAASLPKKSSPHSAIRSRIIGRMRASIASTWWMNSSSV